MLSKIGISSSLAQDVFFFLAVLGAIFVFVFALGKRRLIPLLFSGYISFALLSVAPKEYLVKYHYELGFFLAVLIFVYFLSGEIVDVYISASGFLWRIFVLSFLEVMFFLSIIFSILPKKIALGYVSPSAYEILVSSNFIFASLALPLIFIFLIRRKLNH